jgi:8-amino-7-oxononanoate synthase
MLDFTSALYLGMRHPSEMLEPWSQFTTGVPAALASSPGAPSLGAALADLQGCEHVALGTSTLHLFWDLFGMLAGQGMAIYMDDGLYAIARWGIERAEAQGVRVQSFPHHDGKTLLRLLERNASSRSRPVVVADGYCPGCARPAPLIDYLKSARKFGGYLIMDDTQALGVFGQTPRTELPYGSGGGGMLSWHNLRDRHVLVVSSLAKGFGVPVAALAGSRWTIECFERQSETKTHCSPPSNAVLSALAHALAVNRVCGDALRRRLANLVGHFRNRLRAVGLTAIGGVFPVQTIAGLPAGQVAEIHESLAGTGVKAILRRDRCRPGVRLTFIVNARHTHEMIDQAVRRLAHAKAASLISRGANSNGLPRHNRRGHLREVH